MLMQRRAYTAEQIALMSRQLVSSLWSLPQIQDADRIMGYLSFDKELSLDFFMQEALQKGKKLYVPHVVDEKNSIIEAVELQSLQDVEYGMYGIRIPCGREVLHPQQLDVVLVPGVAFSKAGQRLGMGKGYYDRFLQRTNATKMGVILPCNLLEELPTAEHDQSMEWVITTEQVLKVEK